MVMYGAQNAKAGAGLPHSTILPAKIIAPKKQVGQAADCADVTKAGISPPGSFGTGFPRELLGEDFAGGVGVDEGFHAPAGARVARVGESVKNDVEALWGLFDAGFGEAGSLEEEAGDGAVASGIESGRGFGLEGSDCGLGIEASAGADLDFHVVEGAFGFDDAVPAERGGGFGEGGGSVGCLAVIGAGFQDGQGAAVKDRARADVENQGG